MLEKVFGVSGEWCSPTFSVGVHHSQETVVCGEVPTSQESVGDSSAHGPAWYLSLCCTVKSLMVKPQLLRKVRAVGKDQGLCENSKRVYPSLQRNRVCDLLCLNLLWHWGLICINEVIEK